MSRTPRGHRRTPPALWVLYVDTFTMAVGFYMLVPLLAVHLLDDLGLSVVVVGALAAVRTAAQNGTMPLAAWVADRVDYRRAICAGVLVRAAGFAAFGLAGSTTALVVASVLTGLGGALFHPASYAAYAALARGRDRVRVYSTRELVSNLGFVVGPVVGGLLARSDFALVSRASAALFLVAFVVTVLGLPRTLSGSDGSRARLWSVFADRAFMAYCGRAAALWFLVCQLYLVVPVRARDVLPDAAGVGLVYSAAAVLMVVTMLPLNGAASSRLPAGRILAIGSVALAGGIAVMGLWDSVAGLFVGVAVFTLGQVLAQPVMNSVAAGHAVEGRVASYFGVQGLAFAVGGVVGSTVGGLLYSLSAGSGPLSVLPWVVFLVWGAVLGLAFWRTTPPLAAR